MKDGKMKGKFYKNFFFSVLSMAFFFTRIVRYVIFAVILFYAVQYFLRWKSYVISPKIFRTAATASLGR